MIDHLALQWPEIVGPHVAAVTRFEKRRGGVVTIRVDSPAWAEALHAMTARVLLKLHIGGQWHIREIRWSCGEPSDG